MKSVNCLMFIIGMIALSATAKQHLSHEGLADGFYVGAEGGWHTMRGDVSHSIRSNFGGRTTDLNINQQVASDGLFGVLHLGFGEKWERFYFATELFGNLNDGKDDGYIRGVYGNNPLVLSFMFRSQGSLGVDFLPGFYPTSTSRVYAHLGFVDARYELVSESFGRPQPGLHKWLPGGRVGIGMQSKLSEHLAIRADTTYNVFDSWMPYNNGVVAIKFSPRAYTGTIGLDYLFG